MHSNGNSLDEQKLLMHQRAICTIILACNNEGSIVDVVSRTQAQCNDVTVICYGSTDRTMELLSAMPAAPELVEMKECGKGCAIKHGLRHALERGFSYAITLDADSHHRPEDIPILLEANIDNPGAIIVGGLKKHRLYRQPGFRLYPLKRVSGRNLLTSKVGVEQQLLALASWKGVRLVNAPVTQTNPDGEQKESLFMLSTLLLILTGVYGLPLSILRAIRTVTTSLYDFSLFTLSVTLLLTPISYIYLKIGPVTEKKRYNIHRALNWMARMVQDRHWMPGIKFSLKNPSGETFEKPSVIICNHQSHLDLIPMLAITPKVVLLTTDWVWRSPFYGYIIHNAEFLPASYGIDAIIPQIKSLVERGYSIAIYPEGTRSMDCSIGRFHKGAFYIADQLGLDITPVVLYGTGKVLPKRGRYLRRWPIQVEIDKRLDRESLLKFGATHREQASAIRKYYIRRYKEISNTIEQNV